MSKRVILITGASSGLGKACAEYLSTKNYIVYGTSRKKKEDNKYKMIQMDVTSDASVKAGINLIVEQEGRLDVIVNNAGMGITASIEDTSVEDMKFQFETNYFGVLRVCHAVLPIMRKQKSGYIINVASITGDVPIPFQGAYSASKAAVQSMTEVLRMEIKPFGIHAVVIDPGDFVTGFTDSRTRTKNADNPIYLERLNRSVSTMEEDEKNGSNPIKLAKLVESIINKRSPKLRYMTGPYLELFTVHLRNYIPSKWFEWIIMKYFKV